MTARTSEPPVWSSRPDFEAKVHEFGGVIIPQADSEHYLLYFPDKKPEGVHRIAAELEAMGPKLEGTLYRGESMSLAKLLPRWLSRVHRSNDSHWTTTKIHSAEGVVSAHWTCSTRTLAITSYEPGVDEQSLTWTCKSLIATRTVNTIKVGPLDNAGAIERLLRLGWQCASAESTLLTLPSNIVQ